MQRFADGAVSNAPSCERPHAPLIGSNVFGALQAAVVPPDDPEQFQVKLLPVKTTELGLPGLHRPDAGATSTDVPLAVPQKPLIGVCAVLFVWHMTVLPPLIPLQE